MEVLGSMHTDKRLIRQSSSTNRTSPAKMPCRDFTSEDIIAICSDISISDNMHLKSIRKKSIFRRGSGDDLIRDDSQQSLSHLARRLSVTSTGIPCTDGQRVPESPTIEKKSKPRKFSVDSSLERMEKYRNPSDPIPGLKGRDLVAVAIICDSNGNPVKTYTENEDIPEDEIKTAGQIYMSRVPVPTQKKTRKISAPVFSSSRHTNNNNDVMEGVRKFHDVLHELDINKIQKLMKKLDRVLAKLHTTDLNTALSFLKTERYIPVKKEIKATMYAFAAKDLKMTPYP